jgi:hypothetical protein
MKDCGPECYFFDAIDCGEEGWKILCLAPDGECVKEKETK